MLANMFARPGIVKAADYAFGSNPPYGLRLLSKRMDYRVKPGNDDLCRR
jgi:hypothetical protein